MISKRMIILTCVAIHLTVGFGLAQVVPSPHVHADYESRLTGIETNHRTFMVMTPIVLTIFGAILAVMWKTTQLVRNTTDALELKHSNALTAVDMKLAAVKDSVDRIEKLISDTVLFGSSGLRTPNPHDSSVR